jgi:hypothetical protein
MHPAHERRQRLHHLKPFWPTRNEAHELYRQALANGFPITRCPPTAWQIMGRLSPVKLELAMLADELAEMIQGLPRGVSGKATVARTYKHAVRAITLAGQGR